jgi:hypothetical protein
MKETEFVYAMAPKKVTWFRDGACNAPVFRLGFPVVPDFAGTIHSYTGETLPAGIVDCLSVEDTPRPEDQLKSNIGIARMTAADGLLLAQPFAPMLFRQGPQQGPTLLMQFLRGELNEEALEKAWEKGTTHKRKSMAFKDVRWPCGRCGKDRLAKDYVPAKQDVRRYTLDYVLPLGAWRSCRSCLARARPAPANTKWCKECEEYLPLELFNTRGQDGGSAEVCVKHLKTFQQEKQGPVRCSRCGEERQTTEYHAASLKGLQEAHRLHEAVCLHCDPVHLPRDWEKKRITCSVCLEALGFSAFSLEKQKQVAQKQFYTAKAGARCLECQFPACSHCGKPTTSQLNTQEAPKTKQERDKFLCRSCRYPPCSECGEPMTASAERKWREKAVPPGTAWTCPTCKSGLAKDKLITCAVCGDGLPFEKFSAAWQKEIARTRKYTAAAGARCLDCQAKEKRITCAVCFDDLPFEKFSVAW